MLQYLVLSAALAADGEAPPIVKGDPTSEFENVGTLVISDGRYIYGSFCSAELIHERWVLTAAHCLDSLHPYGYDIYFLVGSDIGDQSTWIEYAEAKQIYPHPNYNPNRGTGDIGLLELKEAITAVAPLPLNDDDVRNSWVDQDVTFVGWGITGDNRNDSGVKRTVDVPLYWFDEDIIYTYSPSGETICSGDSGGAALMKDGDTWEMVGVSVFGFDLGSGEPYCSRGEPAAGSTRVDAYLDWIAGYVDYVTVDDLGAGTTGPTGGTGTPPGAGGGNSGATGGEGEPIAVDEPARPTEDLVPILLCGTGPATGGLVTALLALAGLVRRRRG